MGLFSLFQKKAPQIVMVDVSLVTSATFQKEAKEAVKSAREIFKVDLDFSPKSVKHIDKIIDEGWGAPLGERKAYEFAMSILTLGSYLGEVIIKHLGGRWQEASQESNPVEKMLQSKIVDLGNIAEIYPFGKVFKRFANGKEDSLEFYYKSIARSAKSK